MNQWNYEARTKITYAKCRITCTYVGKCLVRTNEIAVRNQCIGLLQLQHHELQHFLLWH